MKAFIKTGETLVSSISFHFNLQPNKNTSKTTNYRVAQVSVTLRNEGVDGFKTHEYGRSITIERKFTADSNAYSLKDFQGRNISKTKEELNAILDHFNIQVENPLMILNQDTAREFLTNTDAAEKYKVRIWVLSNHNSGSYSPSLFHSSSLSSFS